MINSHTIYLNPSPPISPENESNRISYWLERLFNQEKDRKSNKNTGKNSVEKREMDRQAIEVMVHNSNTILISVSSVFPFKVFPTTINVEAGRVTIITRQAFASQVHSVDIRDISSVFIETSIIFAAITLISKTYAQKELVVKGLWKKEAIRIRRIIEGLRMFERRDINITDFSSEELLRKLEELSATKIVL